MTDALRVDGLSVAYEGGRRVVDDVSIAIARGETYGLAGESGCGKTTIALAVARYLSRAARVATGRIVVDGQDVHALDARELRAFRARSMAFAYQEPDRALNPTMRVGRQIAEAFVLRGLAAGEARSATVDALERVGFHDPQGAAARYPHELSGGQQQRVVIAMALATRPSLLVLDEPTTGLDRRVEAEVMALVAELRQELQAGVLLITHDLPLIGRLCDRVGVLHGGAMVEEGDATDVLARPRHPHVRALVDAVPSPDEAKARPPVVVPTEDVPAARVRRLSKRYGSVVACRSIDLTIRRGEVLGLVGESGSGKTTLGRCIAGLTSHEGSVELGTAHPGVQMVFQSPDASLNPRRTVRRTLERAIKRLGGTGDPEGLAARVGLGPELLDAVPKQLSGGQKQRVAIARAFAGPVSLVICDEPVSALDVSVQARILDLLLELQAERGVSCLLISHDLAVVRRLADRVAVMYRGDVVELRDTEAVFTAPQHPYTQTLLRARVGSVAGEAPEISTKSIASTTG